MPDKNYLYVHPCPTCLTATFQTVTKEPDFPWASITTWHCTECGNDVETKDRFNALWAAPWGIIALIAISRIL